jgi:hypothetical protein
MDYAEFQNQQRGVLDNQRKHAAAFPQPSAVPTMNNPTRHRSDPHPIIDGPSYVLAVRLTKSKHGNNLRLVSIMPGARRPEEQVKFQCVLTDVELNTVQKVLSEAVAPATI